MKPEMEPAVTNCPNCHTPMPRELRFCRNCGFRLGEGTAEYNETVRFQNAPAGSVPGNSSAGFPPYSAPAGLATYPAGAMKKRKRKLSGMAWMFIILLLFFVGAATFSALIKPRGAGGLPTITRPAGPRAYIGVNRFEAADEGGVTFESVDTPGGPADLAGLVGGDIIKSFDGHPIEDDDQMRDLIAATPIGKEVEITYVRDGETKTVKLAPISPDEFQRLQKEAEIAARGRGFFGYDNSDAERVPVEGTKIFGVRLDDVYPSRPADIAGVKEGDVVIEFAGVPIRTPEELSARIRRTKAYETVKVVVMRNGEKLEIPVKLGSPP